MKKNLIFSILAFVLFFSLTELAARLYEKYYPSDPVDFDGGFSRSSRVFTETNNGLMTTQPNKYKSFLPQTFRKKKPNGTFRIFLLGESSVFRLGNLTPIRADLQKAVDQKKLRLEIINAGGNSYGSERLSYVAEEISDYGADLVLIYMGHNEFEEVEQFNIISPQWAPYYRFFFNSAQVRVLAQKLFRFEIDKIESFARTKKLSEAPDYASAWRHQFTLDETKERMKKFKENLTQIVHTFQGKNIQVLIGSIPSNLRAPELSEPDRPGYEAVQKLYQDKKYAEALKLGQQLLKDAHGRHQSSDTENEIIKDVADAEKIKRVDVASAITAAEPHHIPGETLFDDHCHLNEKGNLILMKSYLPEILSVIQQKTSEVR